jgi:hypothetical protein
VLLARIVAIEERLDTIEGRCNCPKIPDSCRTAGGGAVIGPCWRLPARNGAGRVSSSGQDLRAAGDVAVEVKRVNFCSRIPAFRWTTSGRQNADADGVHARDAAGVVVSRVTEGKP